MSQSGTNDGSIPAWKKIILERRAARLRSKGAEAGPSTPQAGRQSRDSADSMEFPDDMPEAVREFHRRKSRQSQGVMSREASRASSRTSISESHTPSSKVMSTSVLSVWASTFSPLQIHLRTFGLVQASQGEKPLSWQELAAAKAKRNTKRFSKF